MDILMDLLHNYTISIKNNTLMAKNKILDWTLFVINHLKLTFPQNATDKGKISYLYMCGHWLYDKWALCQIRLPSLFFKRMKAASVVPLKLC